MAGYDTPWNVDNALIAGQPGTTSQLYSGSGTPQYGDYTNSGYSSGSGGIGDMFGNNTMQTIGGGVDIFKDLFGMYMANKGMNMAKTQMNNKAIGYNNNAQNQQNFTNGTIDAFGSGQQRTNNQMARMA